MTGPDQNPGWTCDHRVEEEQTSHLVLKNGLDMFMFVEQYHHGSLFLQVEWTAQTNNRVGRRGKRSPTGCKPESIIAQSQPRTRRLTLSPHLSGRERGLVCVCDSGNGLELTHCSLELRGWFGVGPFRDRVAVTVYRCRSRAMYSLGNRTGALKFRQEVWQDETMK
jgi:hypothetical protein